MNKIKTIVTDLFPNVSFALIRWRKYDAKKLDSYINIRYPKENENKFKLKALMKFCWVFLGIRYWEFYGMHLEKKKMKQVLDFVPRWEEEDLYFQVNDKKYVGLLENKFKCYNFFKDYYKRKAVLVSRSDKGEYSGEVRGFIEDNDSFIIKPIASYCGQGVKIVNAANEKRIEDLLGDYSGDVIIEELIKQDSRLAAFHYNSVNTIRIFTINYGNTIEVKWPTFRIGRGNATMDNLACGGIGVTVDEKTGMTIRAADERGNVFLRHPDTNKNLIGFAMPEWDSLCQSVKEMAAMCPDCPIMGWDMALTDDGWCVVECNYGPGIIYQYANQSGVRKDFKAIRKRLGAKRGKHFADTKHISRYLIKPM